jgi:hypothetical protein
LFAYKRTLPIKAISANVKLYVNNFDAPDAHFDYSSLFSDAQVEKGGNPEQKM